MTTNLDNEKKRIISERIKIKSKDTQFIFNSKNNNRIITTSATRLKISFIVSSLQHLFNHSVHPFSILRKRNKQYLHLLQVHLLSIYVVSETHILHT